MSNINIDLANLQNGAYVVGHAQEKDVDSLVISLDSTMQGYDLYKLIATRRDGAAVESDEIEAANNTLSISLQAKFLKCGGIVNAQVFAFNIVDGELEQIKASDSFRLNVAESVAEIMRQYEDEPDLKHIYPGEVGIPELSEDVQKTLSAIDSIAEEGEDIFDHSIDPSDITRESGKNINNYGNVVNNTKYSYLWFQVPTTGKYRITSSITSQCFVNVYSSATFAQANLISRVKYTETMDVACEAGQYIAVCAYETTFTITVIYSTHKTCSLKDDVPLTPTMDEQVRTMISEKTDAFYHTGYFSPGGEWVRGDWDGWNQTQSKSYRARRVEPIEFDRDVLLVADDGFYIFLYGESGTISSADNVVKLPANTPAKITVRRINEDYSEVADVDDFATKVKVSTPQADIERLQNTFVDVSMFERIGVCGDSYAGGGGIISGITALTWGKNLERQAGITVDIYAKSGITIEGWNNNQNVGLPALLNGPKCGLYWFAHGINGTSTPEKIGTPEDMTTEPRPSTFYGQYAYAIEQVQAFSPNSRIVIAQILGSSYKLEQKIYAPVNEAIRNIAEHFEIPCIRLADDDFYKSIVYSSSQRSNHPVAMTSAGMAMANRRLLSKCIIDNSDYFINYKGV